MKFEPKDKRQIRRLINNIYIKNIPGDFTEKDIRSLFEKFGYIKSLILQSNSIGQFAFICYEDPKGVDKEYGPICAQKAIDEMNEYELREDVPRLLVKHALKKAEREIQKVREAIRYKASKKRCNLYVKNLPPSFTKEQILDVFQRYGEIENIKLDVGQNNGNKSFAFVCFKEPTDAAKAKQELHHHMFDGHTIMITYYEIKEVRKLQLEEAKDKADWER